MITPQRKRPAARTSPEPAGGQESSTRASHREEITPASLGVLHAEALARLRLLLPRNTNYATGATAATSHFSLRSFDARGRSTPSAPRRGDKRGVSV